MPDPSSTRREHRTRERVTVRQVTDIQASWTEQERGLPGKFTLQLILDNGVEEYVLQPDAEDLDVLATLFKRAGNVYFDTGRKVLMFGNMRVA